jgi:hypothetical protein
VEFSDLAWAYSKALILVETLEKIYRNENVTDNERADALKVIGQIKAMDL